VNQAQVRRHGAVLFACLTYSLTPIWVHDQYSSRYVSRFKHPVDAGPTDPKVLCDVGSAYFKVSQKVETHSCKCLRNRTRNPFETIFSRCLLLIDSWGAAGPPFLSGGAPQGWPPWKFSTIS
jgi:hypothetical protein